ncbi:MAG TPA: hypothetical protein VKB50_09350 [Vicinamibacterales bacterium]|nr:hypothetical protein [Vicinamibacterales bacterium]
MRWTSRLTVLTVLIGVPVLGTAQTITVRDVHAARVGGRVGYGGRGVDVEGSVDSPLLAELFRFRGSMGLGHWVGIGEVPPPAGSSPLVTRVSGAALLFIPSWQLPNLRGYAGIGISSNLPHDPYLAPQRSTRLIFGMETSGDRWDGGPEFECDLPNPSDNYVAGAELIPTLRIGVFMRRRF